VIVATYCPGPGLDRLVRSLDRQTMQQGDFEVIFVDDGSPDGTWSQLESVQRERSNVTIEPIEHTGWPSRPRNVGMTIARGDYVIFVDHDDEIFPDGLRAAWQFAADHDLDVANVKQIQTGNPGHAFEHYRRDIWGTRQEMGVLSLLPMMPHKLYRRQLLLEHGVRFREANGRVVWEDVYFNIDAFAVARRIGTLGRVCVYRHVIGDANTSHSYRPENEEYWRTVTQVIEHVETVLGADEFEADRQALLAHHYRDRVLNSVTRMVTSGHANALTMAEPYMRSLHRRCVPPELSEDWPTRERRIEELLRCEDADALTQLVTDMSHVVGTSHTTGLSWEDASLIVSTVASWTEPPSSVESGFLAARTDAEVAGLRAELDRASSDLILRARDTHETTPLDTSRSTRHSDPSDPLHALRIEARAPIRVPAPGHRGVFDLVVRNAALGFANTRGLRTNTPARVGLIDGDVVIAYQNKTGMLSVDYGQSVRSAINSARCDFAAAQATRTLTGEIRIRVPLTGVHVYGTTNVEGNVVLMPETTDAASAVSTGSAFPAALVGDSEGAHVTASVRAAAGRYRMAFAFGGPSVPSSIALTVRSRLRKPLVTPG
jgi:glycosyltransferase involved in cell wall biosynthesis